MEIDHEQSWKAEVVLRYRRAEELRRNRLESGHWLIRARKLPPDPDDEES